MSTGSPANKSSILSPFPETAWTVVARAHTSRSEQAQQALETICRDYWQPVYSFLRKSGRDRADAQDLTQGFFGRIIEDNLLQKASPEKGRLRSFLLGSLKRFLSRENQRANATKRGGGVSFVPLEIKAAEQEFERELKSEETPEALYDRAWAAQVVARAQQVLEDEYRKKKKTELFEELRNFLDWNATSASYEDAADRLGMSRTNLRTNIYRMRGRFRELLQREIAETVLEAAQVDEELEHLVQILQNA